MKKILTLILILMAIHQAVYCQFDVEWIDISLTPDQVDTAVPFDVVSDFGRREGNSNTSSHFHDGIDISAAGGDDDLGDKIKAIVGGRIKHITPIGLLYNIITIEGDNGFDFGYGHIFEWNNDIVNQFRFEHWSTGVGFSVIVCGDEGYALTAKVLTADDSFTSGNGTTYSVANGTLKNEVLAGDVIAPMGDSGGSTDASLSVHVHLYCFKNLSSLAFNDLRVDDNLIDPTPFLNLNIPAYNVTIEQIKQEGEMYYNNPSFQVRVDFIESKGVHTNNDKYPGAVMDINDVSIKIKHQEDSDLEYVNVKGAYMESRFCDGGARFGTESIAYPTVGRPTTNLASELYTLDIHEHNNTTLTSAGFGNYNKSGIVGCAYKDLNTLHGITALNGTNPTYPNWENGSEDAWDDYFFNDFPTRIKKSEFESNGEGKFRRENAVMGDHLSEVQYPDGNYIIRAHAIGASGRRFRSSPNDLTIDNFMPYAEYVEVRRGGSEHDPLIYSGEWSWTNGSLDFETFRDGTTDQFSSLFVRVRFSEEMKIDQVFVQGEEDADFVSPYYNSPDMRTYYFLLAPINGSDAGQLTIRGRDANNNQLQTNPAVISIKQSNNTWAPAAVPGDDTYHKINTGDLCNGDEEQKAGGGYLAVNQSSRSGAESECIYINFVVDKKNPDTYESVEFSAIDHGDDFAYLWDFGDDAQASGLDTPDPIVLYTEEGPQDVSLRITEKAFPTNFVDLYEHGYMDVGARNPPMTVTLTASEATAAIDAEVKISASVPDGEWESFLNYTWDFGNGADYRLVNSGDYSEYWVSYDSEGPKTISVTVTDAVQSRTKAITDLVYISGYPNPIVVYASYIKAAPPSNGTVQFTGNFSHGDDIFNNEEYYWDFGDGGTSREQNPQYTYKRPGSYFPRLTVCDESGCSNATNVGGGVPLVDSDFDIVQIANLQINSFLVKKEGLHCNFQLNDVNECPTTISHHFIYIPYNMKLNFRDASKKLFGSFQTGSQTYIKIGKKNSFPDQNDPSWDYNDVPCSGCLKLTGTESEFDGFVLGDVEPNNPWIIYYHATDKNPNISYPINHFIIDANPVASAGSIGIADHCDTELLGLTLDTYCVENDVAPIFNITWAIPECEVGHIEVTDLNTNTVVSSVPRGWPPRWNDVVSKEFPYTTQVRVDIYQDCEGGTNCYKMGSEVFDVTVYGVNNSDIRDEYNVCLGARTQVGTEGSGQFEYEWSSTSTTEVGSMDYISNPNIANPEFSGVVLGDHEYTFKWMDKVTGCYSDDYDITISVNSVITADSYNLNDRVGEILVGGTSLSLQAPIVGGERDYEFEWSPSDYLDNPRSPNPIFTPPDFGTTLQYEVLMTYKECTEATGTVDITITNPPPTELSLDGSSPLTWIFSWSDNSIESRFVIERSVNGGPFEAIYEVGSNIPIFSDMACIDTELQYCYRVRAFDVNNVQFALTDPVCTVPRYAYYDKWEITLDDVETDLVFTDQFAESRIGQLIQDDEETILFFGVEEKGQYRDPAFVVDIDRETGSLATRIYRPGLTNYDESFQSVIKTPDGKYLFLVTEGNNNLSTLNNFDGTVISELKNNSSRVPIGTGNTTAMSVEYDDFFDKANVYWSNGNVQFSSVLLNLDTENLGSVSTEVISTTSYFVDNKQHIIRSEAELKNALEITYYNFLGQRWTDFDLPTLNGDYVSHVQMENDQSDSDYRYVFANTSPNNGAAETLYMARVLNYKSAFLSNPERLPEIDWEKEFWSALSMNFIKTITLSNNEFMIVSYWTVLDQHFVQVLKVDDSGDEIWKTSFEHNYADGIFDVLLVDNSNLLFAATTGVADQVNLKMVTPYPEIKEEVTICTDVLTGESDAAIAEDIYIGGDCEVSFEPGSSSNYTATNSITLGTGTHIESGAYFTAVLDENLEENCDVYTKGRLYDGLSEEGEQFGDNLGSKLNVFPNPNSGEFSVDLSAFDSQAYEMKMYNINGREVWSKRGSSVGTTEVLSLGHLSSGIYILNVSLEDEGTHHVKVQVLK